MSQSYIEMLEGDQLVRNAPGERHEIICARLHDRVAGSLGANSAARLLPPRTKIPIAASTFIRPDLAVVTVATGKLWLAAEIISSDDHHTDTVDKKVIYEDINVPRLWMIDPRYDNVEVYHCTAYGLALKHILATREILQETLLPDFQYIIAELFAQ